MLGSDDHTACTRLGAGTAGLRASCVSGPSGHSAVDGAFPEEARVCLEFEDLATCFTAILRIALDCASTFAESTLATSLGASREGCPVGMDAIYWATLCIAGLLGPQDGARSATEFTFAQDASGAPLVTDKLAATASSTAGCPLAPSRNHTIDWAWQRGTSFHVNEVGAFYAAVLIAANNCTLATS